jgi:hypothetical protein
VRQHGQVRCERARARRADARALQVERREACERSQPRRQRRRTPIPNVIDRPGSNRWL